MLKPVPEPKIHDMIDNAERRMTPRQQRFFDAVRVGPERWAQTPYGDDTGGFWVVGLLGRTVIWYNEVEGGFNSSRYSTYGTIGEYWSNTDKLEEALQHVLGTLNTDLTVGPSLGRSSPPRSGPYR